MMREAVVRVRLRASEYTDIALKETISLCREAGVREISHLNRTSHSVVIAIQAERPFDEERLSALDYIEWWEHIDRETGVVYLLKIDVPSVPGTFPPVHEFGVSIEEMSGNKHYVDISLVGDQGAISHFVSEYTEAGIPMVLRAISEYCGPRDALDSLTDRQREIVRTAYEMGHYEVPRRVSTADIAAYLDLDPSTVSEHVQRAEHNLLTHILNPD